MADDWTNINSMPVGLIAKFSVVTLVSFDLFKSFTLIRFKSITCLFLIRFYTILILTYIRSFLVLCIGIFSQVRCKEALNLI